MICWIAGRISSRQHDRYLNLQYGRVRPLGHHGRPEMKQQYQYCPLRLPRLTGLLVCVREPVWVQVLCSRSVLLYTCQVPVSKHKHGQGRDHQPKKPHPLPTGHNNTTTVNYQQQTTATTQQNTPRTQNLYPNRFSHANQQAGQPR